MHRMSRALKEGREKDKGGEAQRTGATDRREMKKGPPRVRAQLPLSSQRETRLQATHPPRARAEEGDERIRETYALFERRLRERGGSMLER
uniref:Uncharacterized protein n=1 Tax=Chromera velia CCMP2878 TaxID=1169474 RepID=A0A0G4FIG4_9ALVE|eukprot:Cvel_17099.t1-p1 / transcript=Cvel_17099.t1 / gene=Cvel_17099 / organism=Chromera_velia_CCMP2878 / gene_product=hypothetical protein / transcript_product=hypothetical protein / location=Cvel_scaffold1348:27471-27740(+) / protein_length=90 / sequence_SO=supercontig / SO=protein_coding / is_pseudo=false